MTFVRARQPEQIEARRQQLLASARAILEEGGTLSALSLSELARRARMSKSNIYRYFESREALLLAILEEEWAHWGGDILARFANCGDIAPFLAKMSAERPLMCQLIAAMPSVLEHNISVDTVGAFKARALGLVDELAIGMHAARPERPLEVYAELIHHAMPIIVGLWPCANPSPVVAEVLEAEELAAFRHDFEADLSRLLTLLLRGLEK